MNSIQMQTVYLSLLLTAFVLVAIAVNAVILVAFPGIVPAAVSVLAILFVGVVGLLGLVKLNLIYTGRILVSSQD